jgi:hypothetical protein
MLVPWTAAAQQPVNVAAVNGTTPDLARQTTLTAIETLLSNPITVTGTVALSNASAQSDDNVIPFNETRMTINAVMYCQGASNNIRCPAGDGGNGGVSSTTSRTVDANDSPVYLAMAALNTQLVAHDGWAQGAHCPRTGGESS